MLLGVFVLGFIYYFDETQIEVQYNIKKSELVFYIFFVCILIPFSLSIMECVLPDLREDSTISHLDVVQIWPSFNGVDVLKGDRALSISVYNAPELISITPSEGTAGTTATCGTNGQFNTLKCEANTCTPSGNIANSNKAAAGSITGTTTQSIKVTCDTGYSGGGTATCGTPQCDLVLLFRQHAKFR